MRIQHNIPSMNAYRNYNNNASALNKNLEKLSSGYRINRAGDDAAGLAISEKMRAQITGLTAASKNVKDGISLVKTAEGAMQEIHDMLGRMKELATQSANGTYTDAVDRKQLQKEVDSLRTEINRIADSANFNGQKLLNGDLDTAIKQAASNLDIPTSIGWGDGMTQLGQKAEAVTKSTFTVNLDGTELDMAARDTSTTKAETQSVTLKLEFKDGTGTAHTVEITAYRSASSSNQSWAAGATKIDDFLSKVATVASGNVKTAMGANDNTGAVIIKVDGAAKNGSDIIKGAGKWDLGGDIGEVQLTATGATLKFESVNNPTKKESLIDVSAGKVTLSGHKGNAGTYNTQFTDAKTGNIDIPKVLAKTEFQLTKAMIKAGNKLTIGGDVYEFGKNIKIDDLEKKHKEGKITQDEYVDQVAQRLSQQSNAAKDFSISTQNGKIVLSQKSTSTLELYSKADLDKALQFEQIGAKGEALSLQIGDDAETWNRMDVTIDDMHASNLGIATLSIAKAAEAKDALKNIDDAINFVSNTRGGLGALQNRLEHTSNNLSVMRENIQDAESTIRDTDVADEMMRYTKNNILLQSAQAMLAQANQVPQGVLQLLQ